MALFAVLFQVKGVHIDAKAQRRSGSAGVQGGDDPGEAALKGRQPAFRRALLARALISRRQRLRIGQAHPAIGVNHVAANGQLIAQSVKNVGNLGRGAELLPAGFGVAVKVAAPGAQVGGEGSDIFSQRVHGISCHQKKV